MNQQSALLTFPKTLIERPIISTLVRTIGVEVNILQASITSNSDGRMLVILGGERPAINKAIDYLKEIGTQVLLPARNLVWDETRCTHCGACTGHCPSQALSLDPTSMQVVFTSERCIACELCIPACGYGALESISDHLQRTGEL